MEEDSGKLSRFNAGIAQTIRIDDLQQKLNLARFNPLAQDLEIGRFNYEIMVSACDGLLQESWAKLSPKEKEEGDRLRKLVSLFIDVFPIYTQTKDGKTKVNYQNYRKFMELINLYEKKNKIFLDDHNLNAPNYEDDDDEL